MKRVFGPLIIFTFALLSVIPTAAARGGDASDPNKVDDGGRSSIKTSTILL